MVRKSQNSYINRAITYPLSTPCVFSISLKSPPLHLYNFVCKYKRPAGARKKEKKVN